MIYEWKCSKCGMTTEVTRPVVDYNVPPHIECCKGGQWSKVLSAPKVPFEHLRNAGIFADDNGNFAPRKV